MAARFDGKRFVRRTPTIHFCHRRTHEFLTSSSSPRRIVVFPAASRAPSERPSCAIERFHRSRTRIGAANRKTPIPSARRATAMRNRGERWINHLRPVRLVPFDCLKCITRFHVVGSGRIAGAVPFGYCALRGLARRKSDPSASRCIVAQRLVPLCVESASLAREASQPRPPGFFTGARGNALKAPRQKASRARLLTSKPKLFASTPRLSCLTPEAIRLAAEFGRLAVEANRLEFEGRELAGAHAVLSP